jgi:hypothetical protein
MAKELKTDLGGEAGRGAEFARLCLLEVITYV